MSVFNDPATCGRNCWIAGALIGLLGFILMVGPWDVSFFWSLILALVLGGLVGWLLKMLLCDGASAEGAGAAAAGAAATGAAAAAGAASSAAGAAADTASEAAETVSDAAGDAAESVADAAADAAEAASDAASDAVDTASEAASEAADAVADAASDAVDAASDAADSAAEAASDAADVVVDTASDAADAADAASDTVSDAAEATADAVAPAAAPAGDSGNRDYDGDGVLEGTNEGTRPEALSAPRGGSADDLKQIKGVGPKLEQLLHELGFYHFDQVAAWSADEVAWVDANLKGFRGRVSRDNWVEQARVLAAGGETEFSKRVEDGDVY